MALQSWKAHLGTLSLDFSSHLSLSLAIFLVRSLLFLDCTFVEYVWVLMFLAVLELTEMFFFSFQIATKDLI